MVDFKDVYIVPKRSTLNSRADVSLTREFKFYHSPRIWRGTPIVAANMATTGTISMSRVLAKSGLVTALHKFYSLDDLYNRFVDNSYDYTWVTIGQSNDDLNNLIELSHRLDYQPNIVIDVANAYRESFVEFCKTVRLKFPESIICVGNVCTPEMVQELIIHGGVDIVKVGNGSGSACSTYETTGVGYPQLQAVLECSKAAHGLKNGEGKLGLICSDGGCKTYGDVSKALCGGADFVMIGGLLAGTDECEGEWEEGFGLDGALHKEFLTFYGMSSTYAQEKHKMTKDYTASEGKVVKIPYKGPVQNIIDELLGGIRSCCTYIGATSLKDMSKCASFIE